MIKKWVLLCFATYLLQITAANPLRDLFLLPLSKNNHHSQNCQFLPHPLTSNIGSCPVYDGVQNTCPAPSYQRFSSNDLHQLLYRTILEKLDQKPLNLLSNNDQLQVDGNRCLPQKTVELMPQVVNHYIMVPPEVFQSNNLPEEVRAPPREIRRRRQDSEHAGERKRKRKNQDAAMKESVLKVDEKIESFGNKDTEKEASGDRQPRKRHRKRKENRQISEDQSDGNRKTGRRRKKPASDKGSDKNTTNINVDKNTSQTGEKFNHDSNHTKYQDKLSKMVTLNSEIIHETNVSNEERQNLSKISLLTNDELNSTKTNNSKTNENVKPKGRQKTKKPKQNNRVNENYVPTVKPYYSKEDMLIRDFREKFPNIPEELLKKLINYMRKQLQNDQSSLSNAYYNYLNYPVNFDQFYQTQIANMANNPQITRVNNNSKKKSNKRKRKRKGKKKNSNDCSTIVELTPEVVQNPNENTALVDLVIHISTNNTEQNQTDVQNKPGKLESKKIQEPPSESLSDLVLNQNKTVENREEESEIGGKIGEFKIIQTGLTSQTYKNVSGTGVNSDMIIKENEKQIEDIAENLKTIKQQDSLDETINKSSSSTHTKPHTNSSLQYEKNPDTNLALNKTKNERIINIRILIEPQGVQIVKEGSVSNNDQSNLKQELTAFKSDSNVTESSKLENHTEKITTNSDNAPKQDEIIALNEPLDNNNTGAIQTEEKSELIEPVENISRQIKTHDRDSIFMPALGEEDVVPTMEMNEINDYFPNFEVDNFAYLLQSDRHELENLRDFRYHYTTDRNVDSEEPKETLNDNKGPFGNFEKVFPKKLVIDNENVEDTIQRPLKNDESKLEFITPPTLETPDFKTKAAKVDDSEHFVFYDPDADYTPHGYLEDMGEAIIYSDEESSYNKTHKRSMEDEDTIPTFSDVNSHYDSPKRFTDDVDDPVIHFNTKSHYNSHKRNLEDNDKASVYSEVKSPHYDTKTKKDKEKTISKNIETVFAPSKVVKYGQGSEKNNEIKESSEFINDEVQNNKSGNVSIVFAKSFPW